MNTASHPEIEERTGPDPAPAKGPYHCNESLRNRLRSMRAGGEISNSRLGRGANVNDAVISQYLNDAGNMYSGDIGKVEGKIESWLAKRDIELLAGIPTITTDVTTQIFIAAKTLTRCGLMGKLIGHAGIGKTRGAMLLNSHDKTSVLICVTGQTGTKDAIRSALFSKMGIQGPRKRSGNRLLIMYKELIKRLLENPLLLIFDQAHRLSGPAIDWLTELWNDTHSPQLWLGTDKLLDKLERDEQWASRVAFTDRLTTTGADVKLLVRHQIESRIDDPNGETAQLVNLCAQLAGPGHYRRVEMRLAAMLYLRESPKNHGKTWCELFNQAAAFISSIETDALN
jgi:DNA transposition AAA+ family ATPase